MTRPDGEPKTISTALAVGAFHWNVVDPYPSAEAVTGLGLAEK